MVHGFGRWTVDHWTWKAERSKGVVMRRRETVEFRRQEREHKSTGLETTGSKEETRILGTTISTIFV